MNQERHEKTSVIINFTGDGRGKSSAAFGIAMRHAGYGKKAAIIQFIKQQTDCGEFKFIKKCNSPFLGISCCGCGFTFEHSDDENRSAAQAGWQLAQEALQSGDITMLVLDEFNHILNLQLLPPAEILSALQNRRPDLNVIITGRNAPEALLEICDCVSVVEDVKHYYSSGAAAIAGVDY
ncbi:MAG: cob(I)yrinic acid a,c-diamide adenosyltransferase [Victivallaceae bacterium]